MLKSGMWITLFCLLAVFECGVEAEQDNGSNIFEVTIRMPNATSERVGTVIVISYLIFRSKWQFRLTDELCCASNG